MDKNMSVILGGSSMLVGGFTTVSNAVSIGSNVATALPVLGLTSTAATSAATLTGLALAVGGLAIIAMGVTSYDWADS